jgi:hypothetical protein
VDPYKWVWLAPSRVLVSVADGRRIYDQLATGDTFSGFLAGLNLSADDARKLQDSIANQLKRIDAVERKRTRLQRKYARLAERKRAKAAKV